MLHNYGPDEVPYWLWLQQHHLLYTIRSSWRLIVLPQAGSLWADTPSYCSVLYPAALAGPSFCADAIGLRLLCWNNFENYRLWEKSKYFITFAHMHSIRIMDNDSSTTSSVKFRKCCCGLLRQQSLGMRVPELQLLAVWDVRMAWDRGFSQSSPLSTKESL